MRRFCHFIYSCAIWSRIKITSGTFVKTDHLKAMKPVHGFAFILSSLLLCAGVSARSGFLSVAAKVLHYEKVSGSPLTRAGCVLCHVNPNGGAPWNNFGYAVGFWRGKKQDINAALYSALRYGGDTDHDGIPDTLERMAATNPNDRESKPEANLDVLKNQFDTRAIFDADSDSDGFTDALEVFAGTLPGDASSKPSETLESLKTRFLKAGGLEMFNPVKLK
jgi:Bacterial TSP3 repeat